MRSYEAGTDLVAGSPWVSSVEAHQCEGLPVPVVMGLSSKWRHEGLCCFCRVDYDGEGGRLRGWRGQVDAREGSSAAMSLKSDLHRHGEEVLSWGW